LRKGGQRFKTSQLKHDNRKTPIKKWQLKNRENIMDEKTVRRVAGLAHLKMDDAEIQSRVPQLSNIMSFIEQLSEVDTDNVEPLANVANISLRLREDEINDGDCAEKVLANAPEETLNFFVVPKIIETKDD
jgi:aspartyl-tRNA(Asn)/glutamyl-tRNA(Gln) amidotransferase subunit C